MVLFELLQLVGFFLDYLRVEYLWHALIRPLTNRNGMREKLNLLPGYDTYVEHKSSVQGVVYSPGGERPAIASHYGRAQVWNATTGEQIASMEHNHSVQDTAFSPDGIRLVTASGNKATRIWDPSDGRETRRMIHEGSV